MIQEVKENLEEVLFQKQRKENENVCLANKEENS